MKFHAPMLITVSILAITKLRKQFSVRITSWGTPKKAKDNDLIIFTKEDFQTYPNLIATDLRFKNEIQISDAAPQQNEFKWGTAELVTLALARRYGIGRHFAQT